MNYIRVGGVWGREEGSVTKILWSFLNKKFGMVTPILVQAPITSAIDWEGYKQQKPISHSSENWQSKIRTAHPLQGCRQPASHCILLWREQKKDIRSCKTLTRH